jgi:protein-disulfide isomerase
MNPMARASTRNRNLFIALGAALVVALALIVASRLSADSKFSSSPTSSPPQAEVAGAAEVRQRLDGIPQSGTAIGKPDAPVTLVEYADLQCPFCAEWARATLPFLIQDYVRTGKLRIEFRGLAFIGADSQTALQETVAAGRQDKLWYFVELLYANQGQENSGWVTEDLLSSIAGSVPGLDQKQLAADRDLPAIGAEMAKASAQAQAAGVRGTPSFEIGPTGGPLHALQATSLAPPEFRAAIEAQLAG